MIEIKIPAQRAKQANPGGMGPEMAYLMTAKEAASEVAAHRWPHYVYALCSDTGAAFYVGKGAGPRLLAHAAEAAAGGDSAKCQMIRRAGDRLRYAIFLVCQDEAFAAGVEAWLINAFYDDLTNIKPGSAAACLAALQPLDPYQIAIAKLEDTLRMLDEAQEATDRAARRAAARCETTRALLAEAGFDV